MNLLEKKRKNSSELICGIDEAGRGPVLGPLVLCGVCFTKQNLDYLLEIGVKDSKKLTAKRRKQLASLIKKKSYSYKTIVVSAKEIDEREKKKITMNRLEELKMAEIINYLKPEIIYIDAADVNEERFGKSIEKLLNFAPKKIISKHKADDLYPIVSASSIIAKDKRDELINKIKLEYGDIGSGYPSDKKTINFLREWIRNHKVAPPFARQTWATTQKILLEELKIKKITDFFN
ncbi:MAG: ribonuclease HII [Promethearchaeota archaeon]